MPYQILLTKTATKQLDKLPNNIAENLLDFIQTLENDPRPNGCKKLKGRDGFRVRQGNYRIIYDIFDDILIVEVIAVGHRKDIYD
jgi:mRNA interferase RelE/StbE